MNKKNIRRSLRVFGLLIGLAGTILTFIWYDWKLAVIMFLLAYSNNISMKYSKKL
jgi:hypothetical protein